VNVQAIREHWVRQYDPETKPWRQARSGLNHNSPKPLESIVHYSIDITHTNGGGCHMSVERERGAGNYYILGKMAGKFAEFF
jgi:hypothetical protein